MKCWYCTKKKRAKNSMMCKTCGVLKKRKIFTVTAGCPTVGINRKKI